MARYEVIKCDKCGADIPTTGDRTTRFRLSAELYLNGRNAFKAEDLWDTCEECTRSLMKFMGIKVTTNLFMKGDEDDAEDVH